MKEFNYTIKDPFGLHARPIGQLVKLAKTFEAASVLSCGEKKSDMKKLMNLMGLGIRQNDNVTVRVEGPDEEACAAALEQFLADNV